MKPKTKEENIKAKKIIKLEKQISGLVQFCDNLV